MFVYGTLKSGHRIDLGTFEGAELVGPAKTNGHFTMYNMGGSFPAVVPGGEHIVVGEVWEVTPEVLAELDFIEGYPAFYRRQVIETSQGPAWMYYLLAEPNDDIIKPEPGEREVEWKRI